MPGLPFFWHTTDIVLYSGNCVTRTIPICYVFAHPSLASRDLTYQGGWLSIPPVICLKFLSYHIVSKTTKLEVYLSKHFNLHFNIRIVCIYPACILIISDSHGNDPTVSIVLQNMCILSFLYLGSSFSTARIQSLCDLRCVSLILVLATEYLISLFGS